jgi:hypothetical protein
MKGLEKPLLIVSVEDEITGTDATVHRIILGFEAASDCGGLSCMRDWGLLVRLNELQIPSSPVAEPTTRELTETYRLINELSQATAQLALPFSLPKYTAIFAMLGEADQA